MRSQSCWHFHVSYHVFLQRRCCGKKSKKIFNLINHRFENSTNTVITSGLQMRYWIKAVIIVVAIAMTVSYSLDNLINYTISVNQLDTINHSWYNVSDPIAMLVAFFIVHYFVPKDGRELEHYYLIKKILLVVTAVYIFYSLSDGLVRAYAYDNGLLVILVTYSKSIVVILVIIFAYNKFKSGNRMLSP